MDHHACKHQTNRMTNHHHQPQYNTLNGHLPNYDELPKRLLRSAFIGFCSSFVSDCCSNSIRVVKTAKQTSTVPVTYTEVVKVRAQHQGARGGSVAGREGREPGTCQTLR